MLKVNVAETYLRNTPYVERSEQAETEDRWLICNLREGEFVGACAATRIDEVIEEFLRRAEANRP